MGDQTYISPLWASLLVTALPLLAAVLQALMGKKGQSGNLALLAIIGSTALSALFVFGPVWNSTFLAQSFTWFTVGTKTFSLGIMLNNLTVLMQLIVCVIALAVHVYSRAYMKGDAGVHRYWMYLSLFCFAMLGLCISKNLLMMYVFWELVGFASYLLIGFWFTKPAAVEANKKAFIINRIGDLGFLIGIALVYVHLGSLDLVALFGDQGAIYGISTADTGWVTAAGLAFFVGSMAKSAQFPLHVWLPDAMEGPTAVSSLIHAATMVAAGVFLLATVFPLFNATVLLVIAIIGTATAVAGAFFALAQHDIKKILAFSTISQLGFMMVGVGIGAWDAAMFHLSTHAFFKCLLFLCAGAVIHEMAHVKAQTNLDFDPQDLRHMGGLRKYMPKTFVLMCVGALALAGFPLTSGFLSKDALVISAFEWAMIGGGIYLLIPILLFTVSILTAFYIGRLIFKAFFGKLRLPPLDGLHMHEAPKMMLWPMFFLGICSLFFVFSWNPLSYHDAGILQGLPVQYGFPAIHLLHGLIPVLLTVGTLLVWWLGWHWYVQGRYPLSEGNAWVRASLHQGYLNAFYDKVFVKPTLWLSASAFWLDRVLIDGLVHASAGITLKIASLSSWIDRHIVDGLVNVLAGWTYYLGHLLRWVQNGRLQNYLGFALTIVLIGIIYLIVR